MQDRFEIVVPRADKDRAVEIGGNLISSPHQQISAVAHALKRPTDPPAADYDRRRHLGGGGGGGGGGSHERRRCPNPNPRGKDTGEGGAGNGSGGRIMRESY